MNRFIEDDSLLNRKKRTHQHLSESLLHQHIDKKKKDDSKQVVVCLVDLQPYGADMQGLLRQKFQNQNDGFIKWFRARELFLQELDRSTVVEKFLPIEFKDDPEVLERALLVSKQEWLGNVNYVQTMIVEDYYLFRTLNKQTWLTEEMKLEKEYMFKAALIGGRDLREAWDAASDEMKDDRELMMISVRKIGDLLQHASDRLKNDKDVVLEALRNNCHSMCDASDAIKGDKHFILRALEVCPGRHSPSMVRHISEKLKDDEEVMFKALSIQHFAFSYASERLRSSREFVMRAIQDYGKILEFACDELQYDEEILQIMQDKGHLLYASEEMRDNKEFVLNALCKNVEALQYASSRLTADREVVLEGIKSGRCMRFVQLSLRNNKEFMIEACKICDSAFRYVSKELRNDRTVVLEALKTNGLMLEYAKSFQDDREVVLTAVRQNGYSLLHASQELKMDESLMIEAVIQNGYYNDRMIHNPAVTQRLKDTRLVHAYHNLYIPSHYLFATSL